MTILPALTGKKIDKLLGKGSVALITDESLIALRCYSVNGVENCISIAIHDSRGCCDVGDDYPERYQMDLVRELSEESPHDAFLTMPMCHREKKDAWLTAAKMFDALAVAARAQAAKP